ncbi:MAG: rhomboid protease GluP [Myxococcota bacterium]|jgi:rhomboid protease GluP
MRNSHLALRPDNRSPETPLKVATGAALLLGVGLGAIWLWSTSTRGETLGIGPSHGALIALGANVPSLVDSGEWHRIFTAVVLHSGAGHLVQNVLWLVLLGAAYGRLTRPRRMVGIALATGALGQAASYLFRAGTSVGASGAVYGLAGALVVTVWQRRHLLEPDARWRVLLSTAVFVVILLVAPLMMAHADHAAHFGGFLTGVLLAAALAYRRPIPR